MLRFYDDLVRGKIVVYLTGKPKDMDVLRRALGFVESDPALDNDLKTHTGMVRAGNEAMNRWLMVPTFSSQAHRERPSAAVSRHS